jgi:hypothetical protein
MTCGPSPQHPAALGGDRGTPVHGHTSRHPGSDQAPAVTPTPSAPTSSAYVVLHRTKGHLNREIPLDRASHECRGKTGLGWHIDPGLRFPRTWS